MIIINQWATDHVEYHSDPIKIDQEDDVYDIIVADKKMASSKDKNLIDVARHPDEIYYIEIDIPFEVEEYSMLRKEVK